MPLNKNTHGAGGNCIKKRSGLLQNVLSGLKCFYKVSFLPIDESRIHKVWRTSLEACLIISCNSSHDFLKDH